MFVSAFFQPEGVLVKQPQIIAIDPSTNGVGEFTT